MKPAVIVQHEADAGPGHFERYLLRNGLPYQTVCVFDGESMPGFAQGYSGLCSLGGTMSVNDELPWIDHELSLMRDADRCGVPIIGHCLGGQLLARAFGAQVTRSAIKEIGWGEVHADDIELAREWVGTEPVLELFQWHGDTFALPPEARRLLTNRLCANQAFVIERSGFAHLGMQFHVEMTPQLVHSWVSDPAGLREIDDALRDQHGVGVQRAEDILDGVDHKIQRMSAIADRIYDRWARGLRR